MNIDRLLVLGLALGFTATALGQTFEQRLEHLRRRQRAQAVAEAKVEAQRPSVRTMLQQPLPEVNLTDVSAREAVGWLATTSGVPVVIDWDKLALDGIDPQQPVQLKGPGFTAASALERILRQIALDDNLVWEASPWYVRVMTKQQANVRPIVILYPVGDLLMAVPHFDDAPAFDLNEITRGSTGGSGGGALFGESEQERDQSTKHERAQRLADLIRRTVEPEIWRENGGLAGSIAFFNDALIIRAPRYVHRQIGSGGIGAGGMPMLPSVPDQRLEISDQASRHRSGRVESDAGIVPQRAYRR